MKDYLVLKEKKKWKGNESGLLTCHISYAGTPKN